jgi:flagellar hook-length control protein FliK
MSASPLPAVPVASPAPAISRSPSPSPSSSQDNDSAFDTHLQNAQQQASNTQNPSNQKNQNNQTQAGSASSNSASASSTNPIDDSDSDNSSQSGSDSLVSTVLNLIDQATGDATSNTGKTGSSKSTDDKTPVQTNNAPPQPSALHAVAVLPPPVVPTAMGATTGSDNASTSTGVNALQANGSSAGNPMTLAPQKASAANADDGDDADADAGDDDSVIALNGSVATAPLAGDGTQALASTLSAASHVVAGAAAALPIASNASDSTPDLSALRGVIDATAVATPTAANSTGGHALSVNSPVGSSGFAKELGQQVTWLSGQDIKQAQIRLNPQDLGPLDVKVNLEHGRVDVAFVAQHPATVAAVQQGLDQLHQMLGGQGLSLGHTSVGQHSAQQQFGGQQQPSSGGSSAGDADQTAEPSSGETLAKVAIGLVDAFA